MVVPLTGGGTVHKLCLCGCAHACVTVVTLCLARRNNNAISTNNIIIFVSVMLTPRMHTLCMDLCKGCGMHTFMIILYYLSSGVRLQEN